MAKKILETFSVKDTKNTTLKLQHPVRSNSILKTLRKKKHLKGKWDPEKIQEKTHHLT